MLRKLAILALAASFAGLAWGKTEEVVHLTDADFKEKVADGKASLISGQIVQPLLLTGAQLLLAGWQCLACKCWVLQWFVGGEAGCWASTAGG